MVAKGSDNEASLTPDQLGELYPTPKTYDEQEQATHDRQELFKARRTRLPAFKIALFGAILFAAIAYYSINVELLWMMGDLAVTSFSYAVWFILFLFTVKWLRYTANIFYEYSSPMLAFWIIYGAVMGGAIFAWQKGIWLAHNDIRWFALLIALQFSVCYILAKLFIKK